jgi:hypothetical protein
MRDPFQVLGLPADAAIVQIEQAFRKLARRYPPELAPRRFAEIHRSYKQLTAIGDSLPGVYEKPSHALDELFPPPTARLSRPEAAPPRPGVEDYEPLIHGLRRQLLRLVLRGEL